MEAMASNWTDERLEERFDRIETDIRDLRGEMNSRFDRMDDRFDKINADVNTRFDRVGERFDRVDDRFDKMNADVNARFEKVTERLEAMHRLMIQGGIVIIAALLGLIGTQL